jgi:hypothetical protein
LGPHRIGWGLGIARPTVYVILERAGLSRVAWLHRTTRLITRYEYSSLGDLLLADLKERGGRPVGGGNQVPPALQSLASARLRVRPLPACPARRIVRPSVALRRRVFWATWGMTPRAVQTQPLGNENTGHPTVLLPANDRFEG